MPFARSGNKVELLAAVPLYLRRNYDPPMAFLFWFAAVPPFRCVAMKQYWEQARAELGKIK